MEQADDGGRALSVDMYEQVELPVAFSGVGVGVAPLDAGASRGGRYAQAQHQDGAGVAGEADGCSESDWAREGRRGAPPGMACVTARMGQMELEG